MLRTHRFPRLNGWLNGWLTRRTACLAVAGAALLLVVLAIRPLAAQGGNTWTISYFPNTDWSGTPVAGAQAAYIDFNWGTQPPAPGMPATNWTATMTSAAYFYYSGLYTFQALADDEVVVQVDGVTYINTVGGGMSGKSVQMAVPLNAGLHNVTVQYRQYTGTAYLYLNWGFNSSGGVIITPLPTPMPGGTPVPPPPPGPTPTPIPACNPSWQCTCPTQATSVTTDFGNYDACIQQNLQQAACFVSNGQWNAPNTGSIQMEPMIQVWGNCTPGQLQCMQLACNQEPVQATCSKTGAGWFYFGPCPTPTP